MPKAEFPGRHRPATGNAHLPFNAAQAASKSERLAPLVVGPAKRALLQGSNETRGMICVYRRSPRHIPDRLFDDSVTRLSPRSQIATWDGLILLNLGGILSTIPTPNRLETAKQVFL